MAKTKALTQSNIVIDLSKHASWSETKEELNILISKNRSFWGDTKLILRFADFHLSVDDVDELNQIIEDSKINIDCVQTNSKITSKLLEDKNINNTSIPINKTVPNPASSFASVQLLPSSVAMNTNNKIRLIKEASLPQPAPIRLESCFPPNSYETLTVFVGLNENVALRSGHLISYDGNIVVIGDVNPGCQIRSTGSIIVYGKLCGSVHAGFGLTDEEVIQKIFVKALKMGDPLQISIGDYSACSSNESSLHSKRKIYPETARVIDGRIWRISDFE
ncbi:MAG: septum site-determining protein MinC [Candidatus Caenarcaniphilales bacterium]|nr:septum site-determining protein MinC [Candidatus Caenarcaniphilales bacterium]